MYNQHTHTIGLLINGLRDLKWKQRGFQPSSFVVCERCGEKTVLENCGSVGNHAEYVG